MKIRRNMARCTKCNDIIESKNRHDYRTCGCGALSVDGGLGCLRRAGQMDDWEDMSEFVEDDVFLWTSWHGVLTLDEIGDYHLQNIDHHLRTRNEKTPSLWNRDQKLRTKHITPEMEKRGLEPVDEEIPW